MRNGFKVNVEEFKSMRSEDKLTAIFHNTVLLSQNFYDMNDKFTKHLNDDKFNFRVIKIGIVVIALLTGVSKIVGWI